MDVGYLAKDIKIETINENLVEEEIVSSRHPSINIQMSKAKETETKGRLYQASEESFISKRKMTK
jgi:hypothetical protein